MVIESSFTVQAPPQQVWDFLVDPAQMVGCVPGCSKVEPIGENKYRATMTAKVAYITFSANTEVTITRMDPPHELESVASGEDKRLGSNVQLNRDAAAHPPGGRQHRSRLPRRRVALGQAGHPRRAGLPPEGHADRQGIRPVREG